MPKIRTLSRTFLKGHPRAGEKTYFVEQFLNSMGIDFTAKAYLNSLYELNPHITDMDITVFWIGLNWDITASKEHTIRKNHHFNKGDFISLRCWAGKPYNSQKIILTKPVKVKKTWDFKISDGDYFLNGKKLNLSDIKKIAANDGLAVEDFELWFPDKFTGQIICWNNLINY